MEHQQKQHLFNSLWGLPVSASHNPSPTPVTLTREDLSSWKKPWKYVVSEKTDGERATLLLGKRNTWVAKTSRSTGKTYYHNKETNETSWKKPNENYMVLVRRNREIIEMDYNMAVPNDLFDGTMFDGEWIKETFVIFDTIAVKGDSVKNESFEERLNVAKELLPSIVTSGWNLHVKKFYDCEDLQTLCAQIKEGKKGKTDGLIFMPKFEAVSTGRSWNMKKWKPTLLNTIDLHHCKGIWSCIGYDGDTMAYPISLDGGLSREGIYELRPTVLDTEGVNPFNKYTWQIYTERKDKKYPNHITTIEKTLETIDEDITMEEIVSTF